MPKIKQNVKQEKGRYWACVAYPESLPSDWRNILTATGLPCVISPLHDGDLNADESEKKSHYHIIMCFSGPTTYNNVKQVCDSINATIPQIVKNLKGYYRYLTHMDNPEKKQYSSADITFLNGFCPSDYFDFTNSEEDEFYDKIENFIVEKEIIHYVDLIMMLKAENHADLVSFARRHTYHFSHFIKSYWQKCFTARRVPGAAPSSPSSPVVYEFDD